MKVLFACFSLATIVLFAAAAPAITIDDCYVHYKFDDASGTVFADSGPNGLDAMLYRALKYEELPGLDIDDSGLSVGAFQAPLNSPYIGFGARTIYYQSENKEHQVMVRIPTGTGISDHLPGAGDSFALSFYLGVDDWTTSDLNSMIASYNVNGLEWTIGRNIGGPQLSVWSGDADASGVSNYTIDCTSLQPGAGSHNHHFVIQFEGAAGVTGVYVDGELFADEADKGLWGNDYEAFALGARVLDGRNFTPASNEPCIEDFAVISGAVDATDINTLKTSGASSFGARRLAHYTMDEVDGTQLGDSSSYANHATFVSYEPTTMGADVRDVAACSRSGVFGGAVKLASYEAKDDRLERAMLPSVEELPGAGEAFTVSFWFKPDETLGWDTAGLIFNWANDTEGLGFSVGQNGHSDGSIIVRRTDGDATSEDQAVYGVYTGVGPEATPGLNLDPTAFHHFAITVDADGNVTGMYVDGDSVASQIEDGWNITDEGTGAIGCRVYGGNIQRGLCAYLDDLGVVAGELTEAQIDLVMAQGFEALFSSQPLPPGDASGDGRVDKTDAQILATNWGSTTNIGWEHGNFNGDNVIDVLDAAILAANWGTGESEATSAPEPGAFVFLLTAFLGAVLRRRR